MPTRKPVSAPWIAAAVLLVLIGAYVGAYYAMVARTPILVKDRSLGYRVSHYVPTYAELPQKLRRQRSIVHSIVWDSRLRPLFAPIHEFDRILRTNYWRPSP